MQRVRTLSLLFVNLFISVSVFGQGRVSFKNTASTSYYIRTNDGFNIGLMSGVNAYRIGLYVGTNLAGDESSLSLVGLATNAPLAGYFNGGSVFALPTAYPADMPILFQLRGWSFAGGLSFEEAVVNSGLPGNVILLGKSELGVITPTAIPSPPRELFGTNPGQLSQGFVIGVPEPSMHALAALGAIALLLCGRRRRGRN